MVPMACAARLAAAAANGDRPQVDGAMRPRPARPPRLTAADFTPERMLRPRAQEPAEGWRRAIYVALGRSGRDLAQRGRAASARAGRAGQDAGQGLPQGGVHLAQGRSRKDDHVPSRRPHVRLLPWRPGRRARRKPGCGDTWAPAAARDERDDRNATSRSPPDRQVRRRPRLQLSGVEPARGDRRRRTLARSRTRSKAQPSGGRSVCSSATTTSSASTPPQVCSAPQRKAFSRPPTSS